mmetsp:Transcript_21762/g.25033  ORF Transcript_21762/g.25033 Transcript_21762/m.25033 type:complete len:169 (-) Transcript_21762:11-517(-)
MNSVIKMQSFYFNNHCLPEYRLNKIEISNYMEAIMNVLPRIDKEAYFYYTKLNCRQFISIVKNASHLKRLGFIKCKIIITQPLDFTKSDAAESPYQIQSLNFKGCGEGYRGGTLKPADFEKIIKAISESTMKNSLEKLRTTDLQIPIEKMNEMMEQYSLQHIQVIQTD